MKGDGRDLKALHAVGETQMGRREVDILVIVLAVARISIYSSCAHYEIDNRSRNKIPY